MRTHICRYIALFKIYIYIFFTIFVVGISTGTDNNDRQHGGAESVYQAQINNLLSFYSKSNVSLKNLEYTAKLINETPGANFEIPSSHYMLTKQFRGESSVEYYFECSDCSKFTLKNAENSTVSCVKCEKIIDKNQSNYFAFIPFKKHLEEVISANVEQIVKYGEQCKNSSDLIDIQCGRIYKKISAMHPNSTVLSLLLNTDGVCLFDSSSKKSLWPIQLYQNYLPPSMRFVPDNILVVGLYFGDKKPDMSAFVLPFAKECRQINENNGFNIKYDEKEINFLPMVTHCSCDLPAKAMMQEFVLYSGFYACGYCKHPGVSVNNGSKEERKNKKGKTVRYIRKANIGLRNHKETFLTMKKVSRSSQSKPIEGVKALSCMIGFRNFDLIDGFSIDYMHCVLIGTMKKLLDFWLNPCFFREKFHIKKKDVPE